MCEFDLKNKRRRKKKETASSLPAICSATLRRIGTKNSNSNTDLRFTEVDLVVHRLLAQQQLEEEFLRHRPKR